MRILLTIIIGLISIQSFSQSRPTWLLMYYMPYDNDLGVYADSIIQSLTQGRDPHGNAAVAVLVDRPGDGGMEILFSTDSLNQDKRMLDESLQSSNERVLEIFMDSCFQRFHPMHTALFFLNHAGSLNELGLEANADSSWLQMNEVSPVLERHVQEHKKLDLIYYQVCSKGSLEALYEHADYYEVCMASQLVLGAPNYYYEGVLAALRELPQFHGYHLGREILWHEESDMYHGLSLIHSETIREIKEELAILLGPQPWVPIAVPLDYVKDYQYDGVVYVDLLSLIKYLRKYERWDRKLCKSLKESLEGLHHLTGTMRPKFANNGFCGLSVCLTPQPQDMALKFYEGGTLPFVAIETKKGR